MSVTELAEGSAAEHAGELIAAFGFPVVGLILLLLGLRRRSQSRRQAMPPMMPPPGPYPYGYPPPNVAYPNQPGPPPPTPYPPAYPPVYPPGYPATPPRGSSGTALIVVGSLLLAFGVLGFVGRIANVATRVDNSAHVGDCLSQNDFRDSVLAPPHRDCADPDSIFEVVARGDASATCPDGKVEKSAYAYLRDGTTTLCLMLNLKQGQCYTATGTPENPSFASANCTGSGPRVEVVKRVDGSADTSLCPPGSRAFTYPNPARLYCLERVKSWSS